MPCIEVKLWYAQNITWLIGIFSKMCYYLHQPLPNYIY